MARLLMPGDASATGADCQRAPNIASAPPPKRSSPPCAPQASTSVRHLLLPCHWSQRNTIVPDLIKCYGAQLERRGGVRRLLMLVARI